jgi:hypothetical protein
MCFPAARQSTISRGAINAHNLVVISRAGAIDDTTPTIYLDDYQAWRSRRRRTIGELAFYKESRMSTKLGGHISQVLTIAQASDNLPRLLGVPLVPAAMANTPASHEPAVVLSYSISKKYFGDDPDVIGRVVEIGGRYAAIVAIMPDEAWRLTARPDAWLLEGNADLDELPADTRGFVIGQIAAGVETPGTRGRWQFSVPKDGGEDAFDCIPVADRIYRPWMTFLFSLFIAIAALPATTPLPLGEYPAANHPLFAAMRWRRWKFLAMKIVLAIITVYLVSTALAFCDPSLSSNASVYIQFSSSFLGLLFSFRWALRDQRRRCPVCLHVLTNPVSVGQPSRNFLAWHGTELMCAKGHGLLHVPEMATSWFSTQRWLCLDPSWKALFSESCLPSAGVF